MLAIGSSSAFVGVVLWGRLGSGALETPKLQLPNSFSYSFISLSVYCNLYHISCFPCDLRHPVLYDTNEIIRLETWTCRGCDNYSYAATLKLYKVPLIHYPPTTHNVGSPSPDTTNLPPIASGSLPPPPSCPIPTLSPASLLQHLPPTILRRPP